MALPNHAAGEDRGLDERAGRGLFHRADKQFRRHPVSATAHMCATCGATVDQGQRQRHAEWHRQDTQYDEQWMEKVEGMEDLLEHQAAEMVTFKGQLALMTELLGPALDRILHDRETP